MGSKFSRRLLSAYPWNASELQRSKLYELLTEACRQQQQFASKYPLVRGVQGVECDAEGYWLIEESEGAIPLEAMLGTASPDIRDIARMGIQVIDALLWMCYPQSGNIVPHGSLRPACIFLVEGEVKVSDFGVAQAYALAVHPESPRDELEFLAAYTSRESWIRPGAFSEAGDQFALGVMLFQLATGQYPFRCDRSDAPMCQSLIQAGKVRRARDVKPDLPAELAQILDKSLASDERGRFKSLRELRAALAPLVGPDAIDDLLQRIQTLRPSDDAGVRRARAEIARLRDTAQGKARQGQLQRAEAELRRRVHEHKLAGLRARVDNLIAEPPKELQSLRVARDALLSLTHDPYADEVLKYRVGLELQRWVAQVLEHELWECRQLLGKGAWNVLSERLSLLERIEDADEGAKARIEALKREAQARQTAAEEEKSKRSQQMEEWCSRLESLVDAGDFVGAAKWIETRPEVSAWEPAIRNRFENLQRVVTGSQKKAVDEAARNQAEQWCEHLESLLDAGQLDPAKTWDDGRPDTVSWPAELNGTAEKLRRRLGSEQSARHRQSIEVDHRRFEAWLASVDALIRSEQWDLAGHTLDEPPALTHHPADAESQTATRRAAVQRGRKAEELAGVLKNQQDSVEALIRELQDHPRVRDGLAVVAADPAVIDRPRDRIQFTLRPSRPGRSLRLSARWDRSKGEFRKQRTWNARLAKFPPQPIRIRRAAIALGSVLGLASAAVALLHLFGPAISESKVIDFLANPRTNGRGAILPIYFQRPVKNDALEWIEVKGKVGGARLEVTIQAYPLELAKIGPYTVRLMPWQVVQNDLRTLEGIPMGTVREQLAERVNNWELSSLRSVVEEANKKFETHLPGYRPFEEPPSVPSDSRAELKGSVLQLGTPFELAIERVADDRKWSFKPEDVKKAAEQLKAALARPADPGEQSIQPQNEELGDAHESIKEPSEGPSNMSEREAAKILAWLECEVVASSCDLVCDDDPFLVLEDKITLHVEPKDNGSGNVEAVFNWDSGKSRYVAQRELKNLFNCIDWQAISKNKELWDAIGKILEKPVIGGGHWLNSWPMDYQTITIEIVANSGKPRLRIMVRYPWSTDGIVQAGENLEFAVDKSDQRSHVVPESAFRRPATDPQNQVSADGIAQSIVQSIESELPKHLKEAKAYLTSGPPHEFIRGKKSFHDLVKDGKAAEVLKWLFDDEHKGALDRMRQRAGDSQLHFEAVDMKVTLENDEVALNGVFRVGPRDDSGKIKGNGWELDNAIFGKQADGSTPSELKFSRKLASGTPASLPAGAFQNLVQRYLGMESVIRTASERVKLEEKITGRLGGRESADLNGSELDQCLTELREIKFGSKAAPEIKLAGFAMEGQVKWTGGDYIPTHLIEIFWGFKGCYILHFQLSGEDKSSLSLSGTRIENLSSKCHLPFDLTCISKEFGFFLDKFLPLIKSVGLPLTPSCNVALAIDGLLDTEILGQTKLDCKIDGLIVGGDLTANEFFEPEKLSDFINQMNQPDNKQLSLRLNYCVNLGGMDDIGKQ